MENFNHKVCKNSNIRNQILENIFTPNLNIFINNRTFVFTGVMLFGERKKAIEEVVKRGGINEEKVKISLDYRWF